MGAAVVGYTLFALVVGAYSTLVLAPMRPLRRLVVAVLVGAAWPLVLGIAGAAWLIDVLVEAQDTIARKR